MVSNIAEVKLKNMTCIVFARCEAVIFEVLKACVYLAMAYLLVVRLVSLQLHSQGSPAIVLVPSYLTRNQYAAHANKRVTVL